jgi:alpha-amylase
MTFSNWYSKIPLFILILANTLFYSCSEKGNSESIDDGPISVGKDLSIYLNGRGVMMQAFYWDVEPRFEWWNTIANKTDEWADAGIDRIWLPPASKGQSGGYSMGYDPSDYYDLGEYFQHGTTETRFGSRTELDNLIAKAHSNSIEVIADIVMGHNSGGGLQYNPYRDKDTYTLFNQSNGNASGIFNRNYEDYHPNSIHAMDEQALFFEEQDLCHLQSNVQNGFWKNENSVAKYYKNTVGFDGWRFDYVKSFNAQFVKAWTDEVGGWSVGEFYDGNANLVRQWITGSGINAFDFPCLFQMKDAFQQNDLSILETGEMLWKTNPDESVTFVANHDTDREPVIKESDKLYAYAYILTHPGYPTIFYSDYENIEFQEKLKTLIWINRTLAIGGLRVLFSSNEEYIAMREGEGANPGLIMYINRKASADTRTVITSWISKNLHDYSGSITTGLSTDNSGSVQLKAPARGFAIWSLN